MPQEAGLDELVRGRADPRRQGLDHLLAVDGVRDRLTQVASNLLSNAVKYSPTGGRITVTTRTEGDQLRLDVRDEGLGIPPDALETIFER